MARVGGGDTRLDVFVRGLASGALVGAVIAGSTLWERRRRRAAAIPIEPLGAPSAPAPEGPAVGAAVAGDPGPSPADDSAPSAPGGSTLAG